MSMDTKRPVIRDDLAARINAVRGDVPFQRYANRLIEFALTERAEPAAVAIGSVDLDLVNELRAQSLEAGDQLAVPLTRPRR